MRLKRLIQQIEGLEVKGSKEVEVSGICSDSQRVAPGDLFVAKKGLTQDGARYIPDAVEAGATAILTDIYDPFVAVTQLICQDVAKVEAELAAEFFHHPCRSLKLVGVTGTNGKTSCAMLIKHLFDEVGLSAGMIGTVEWVIGGHRLPSRMTTPDVITCQKLLREMVVEKCASAVMEVSSHALDQNRVEEILFDVALFTNLGQDHLDYHGSMEKYASAKGRLFSKLKEGGVAVFNADDPFRPPTSGRVLTYGIDAKADLMAKDIKLSGRGLQFTACHQNTSVVCKAPLLGRFNVYNLLAALAAGVAIGIPLEMAAIKFKTFQGIPGRLERVKNKQKLSIFVDFAHTPDALENALAALRPLTKGRLIVLFGCGGDRDVGKRERMGRIAASSADRVILTNDNPRSEDPEKIAAEILKGCPLEAEVIQQLDRQRAIEGAIHSLGKEDTLLIAGKGHEKEQIFAHKVYFFDDVEIASRVCKECACV